MTAPLITYLGDPTLKAAFLTALAGHEQRDALIKGSYGRLNGYFKGCGIGCSMNSLNVLQGKPALHQIDNHNRVPAELGWPLWLAYLEDHAFENLPTDLAKTWPRRLADAIPVGVTIPDAVLAKLLRWNLLHNRFGIVRKTENESVKSLVPTMGTLFDRTIAGEHVPEAEWNEAARAAWNARDVREAWAAWIAWDAWNVRAARTARAARNARAGWDTWAAWNASAVWNARDAGDAKTRNAFYLALSEEVLRLLLELTP